MSSRAIMAALSSALDRLMTNTQRAQAANAAGIITKKEYKETMMHLKAEYKTALHGAGLAGAAPAAPPLPAASQPAPAAGGSSTTASSGAPVVSQQQAPPQQQAPLRRRRKCVDPSACTRLRSFPSFEEARSAVAAAFQANSLFGHLTSTHMEEVLDPDFKKPRGHGEPQRGHVDWEFKDGSACR